MRRTLLAALLALLALPAAAQDPLLQPDPPSVVFDLHSPIIDAKAAELGNDPVRIYEFVRNELEYQAYFGLMKGPEGALLSGGGNDYDLSALLVSLLRTSGFRARFVRGRTQMPYADAAAMVGVQDGPSAARYWQNVEPPTWIASGDAFGTEQNGAGTHILRTHIWVEAEIPLARYRGAGGDSRGLAWVPLDPASKLREVQPGIVLPLGTSLAVDYLGPDGLYRSLEPRDLVEVLEDQIHSHLASTGPGSTLSDVPVAGATVPSTPGVIPTALPYLLQFVPVLGRDAALGAAHLPGEEWEYTFALALCDPDLDTNQCATAGNDYRLNEANPDPGFIRDPKLWLVWWDTSAAVAGKRVTLSFPPSNPSQHPDGLSCTQASVPTVLVDGAAPAGLSTANPQVAVCDPARAVVFSLSPQDAADVDATSSDHLITAGGNFLVHLDSHGGGPGRTRAASEALRAAEAATPIAEHDGEAFIDGNGNGNLDAGEKKLAGDWDTQELLTGTLLHLASVRYAERMHDAWRRLADYHHRLLVRLPVVGLLSSQSSPEYLFDTPIGTQPSGLLIDIKGFLFRNVGLDGDLKLGAEWGDSYVEAALHAHSELEHRVWAEVAGLEAISTLSGLQLLAVSGEELLSIESGDVQQIDDLTSSCRMDVKRDDRNTAVVYSPGDSLGHVSTALDGGIPVDGGDCTGIDQTTYCEIKQHFSGQNKAWRAPAWDAACPSPLSSVTEELRIGRRSTFAYRDWEGHVYLSKTSSPLGINMALQRAGGSVAGGATPVQPPWWGHSVYNPYGFGALALLSAPGLSFVEVADAAGAVEPEDLEITEAAYEIDASLAATNSPKAMDESVLAADPVSVINGNYHHEVVDLQIAGPGGHDLRLVRSYNSRLDYAGSLGHGWIHTFEQHLRLEPGTGGDPDRLIHVDERGGETIYFDDPDGFLAEPWVRSRLSRNPDSSFSLTRKDGTVLHFKPLPSQPQQGDVAALDSIEDRNGNAITCEYDPGSGQLVKVWLVDDPGPDPAADRFLTLSYDLPSGHLTQIEDWTGRKWLYNVDANGDLASFTDPVQVAAGAQGRAVVYEYLTGQANPDLDHNLSRMVQAEDRDGDGQGDWDMRFAYWSNDMVRSHTLDRVGSEDETTYFDYNFFQRRTRVTHPDGGVDVYVFDRHGSIVRRVSPRGVVRSFEYDPEVQEPSLSVDGLGHATEARYDANGNVVWRKDREGLVETFLYNEFSQPLRHVDRTGAERRWEYDPNGNLLRHFAEIDGELELLAANEYDPLGNLVRACAYAEPGGGGATCTELEYDPAGVAIVRSIDPLGHATRFGPDALGRPVWTEVSRTRADGLPEYIRSHTDYDELDRVVAVTDSRGVARETVYDANGLVFQRRTAIPAPQGPGPVPRLDQENTYDEADRLVATKDALEATTIFARDARGRLLGVTTPLGHETRFEYDLDGNRTAVVDPMGSRSEAVYDPDGRVLQTADPVGIVRTFRRDREGRVLEEREIAPDPAGGTKERRIHETVYDAEGRPREIKDGESHLTRILYDELGRQRDVTTPVGVVNEEGTTLFEYDLLGRLVERTDARGNASRVRYDPLGRVTETIDPLGRSQRNEYDELGNLVRSVDGAGEELSFEYDERGLLLRRQASGVHDVFAYDVLGRQVLAQGQLPANQTTLTAEYDKLDRPVAVTHNSIGTARRAYDADGRISQVVYPEDPQYGFPGGVVVNYRYNPRGQLAGIVDPVAGSWRYVYDEAGRLVRRIDPDGREQWVDYTPEGFVDRVRLWNAAGTTTDEDIDYADYDALGNPRTTTTTEGPTSITYDARSQVTSVAYPDGTDEIFEYDVARNRTRHKRRDATDLTYVLDEANQLTKLQVGGVDFETFGYDGAGRRISQSIPGGDASTYDYDGLGRLTSYRRTNGGVEQYQMTLLYDPTGQRWMRIGHDGIALYFGEWLEVRGSEATRLVHGGGIDNVVAEIVRDTGETRTYLPDAAGNVTHVAVDGQLEAAERRYEAFGAVRSGSSAVERGFAGRPTEGATSLLNLRARHYDTATGRFLQTDPLGLAADHLYAYARNNPYVFGDPLGLDPEGHGTSRPGGVQYADASRGDTLCDVGCPSLAKTQSFADSQRREGMPGFWANPSGSQAFLKARAQDAERLLGLVNDLPKLAVYQEEADRARFEADLPPYVPWGQTPREFPTAGDIEAFVLEKRASYFLGKNINQQNELRERLGLPAIDRARALKIGGYKTGSGDDRDLTLLGRERAIIRRAGGIED